MEKELSRKTIFDGKIIQVTHEEVELENGEHAMREVVYHNGGVGILAIKNDSVLLVKQFRYPNRQYLLEIPAGKLEKGEDPLLCAQRELEEETDHRSHDMTFLLKCLVSPGYCSEYIHIYTTENFEHVDDSLPCDEDEFVESTFMPLDDAYQAILDGDIIDAKTVIAIMYAYNKKNTR